MATSACNGITQIVGARVAIVTIGIRPARNGVLRSLQLALSIIAHPDRHVIIKGRLPSPYNVYPVLTLSVVASSGFRVTRPYSNRQAAVEGVQVSVFGRRGITRPGVCVRKENLEPVHGLTTLRSDVVPDLESVAEV